MNRILKPHRGAGFAKFRFTLALALALTLALVLMGCNDVPSSPPPPDLSPIGDGLKLLAFCLVGASVVSALGRLLK